MCCLFKRVNAICNLNLEKTSNCKTFLTKFILNLYFDFRNLLSKLILLIKDTICPYQVFSIIFHSSELDKSQGLNYSAVKRLILPSKACNNGNYLFKCRCNCFLWIFLSSTLPLERQYLQTYLGWSARIFNSLFNNRFNLSLIPNIITRTSWISQTNFKLPRLC